MPPSADAVSAELDVHRAALTGLCYRMLGSAVDAEDAVQETMLRAMRYAAGFEGRAALRTWLLQIATRVCLDELAGRQRRARPFAIGPAGTTSSALEERPAEHWLEPIADARVVPAEADPAEQAALRESIRLAFVAALQSLAPKQRAVLLLRQVLDISAAETARALDMSVAAVNSALQRARETLAGFEDAAARGRPEPNGDAVIQYVEAFERYDVDALLALARDDVVMSMPPYTLWLQGRATVRAWLLGRGIGCRGSRLVATRANGLPAFGQYRVAPDGAGFAAWSLAVVEFDAQGRIAAMTHFLDVAAVFPMFGLPLSLADEPR